MLTSKAIEIPTITKLLKEETKLPEWLNKKGGAGNVKRLPKRDDLMEEVMEQDIIEFYSR